VYYSEFIDVCLSAFVSICLDLRHADGFFDHGCCTSAAASSLSVVIQLFLNVRTTVADRTMSPSVEKRCLIAVSNSSVSSS
jgi:hypothetical protein